MLAIVPSGPHITPVWCSFTLPLAVCFQTPIQTFPPAGGKKAFSHSVPSACQVLADAHVALGSAYAFAARWDSSDAEFQRALTLEPNNAAALLTFARLLIVRGDVEPALGYLDRARKIERVSPIISAWVAGGYYLTGRLDSALAECARAIQLDSTVLPVANFAGQINVAAGRRDAARRIVEAAGMKGGMTNAPYVYAKLGDTAAANRIVRSMEANSPPPWYATMERASISLALGDTAAVLSGLERVAASVGAAWIQPFSVRDPVYDPIRRSPRFAALLRQTNLDAAALTAPRSERAR
jgi:tetratricopeptide (TPR) repeat protein